MSATNKTPNMELPVYVAEDKPTYLGDWNTAMAKIDTTVTAARNVADSAMETASNASNGVASNTESISALLTDVQLVKSNQTAINEHLTDVDDAILELDTQTAKNVSQLNSGDIAFQFGVDEDGNYGYIKAGADTVTPFKSGANAIPFSFNVNATFSYHQAEGTISSGESGSYGCEFTIPIAMINALKTMGYVKITIADSEFVLAEQLENITVTKNYPWTRGAQSPQTQTISVNVE